jgi:aryl-alcohol dehydrogenase-like predicted oxidoreductase
VFNILGTTSHAHLNENLSVIVVNFSAEELKEFYTVISAISIHGEKILAYDLSKQNAFQK